MAVTTRRYAKLVLDRALEFEDVSAFLLGRDLGEMVQDAEQEIIDAFIARARSGGDSVATQAQMLRLGPRNWRRDPRVLASRLAAFELGLRE